MNFAGNLAFFSVVEKFYKWMKLWFIFLGHTVKQLNNLCAIPTALTNDENGH